MRKNSALTKNGNPSVYRSIAAEAISVAFEYNYKAVLSEKIRKGIKRKKI
jgi:hypothetical protein